MSFFERPLTTTPLVSVVIPTFNRSDLLSKCLESLCCQSFKDFEVLIYDDGSTDNTMEVIRGYEDRLRVRYWKFPHSGRPAIGRNFLIKQSNARYIGFLDSDDVWSSHKLSKSVQRLQSGYDVVYHDLWIVNEEGRRRFRKVKSRSLGRSPEKFLRTRGNVIPASSVVAHRKVIEAVGLFDESESLTIGEDFNLWLRVADSGAKFSRIQGSLGSYRRHGGNISSSAIADRSLAHAGQALEHDGPRTPGWLLLGMAYLHKKNGNLPEARRYFLRSVITRQHHRLRRDRLRSVIGFMRCLHQ